MNTKTIITVVIILVVILVGWGIYQSKTMPAPAPVVNEVITDIDADDVAGMDDATTTPTTVTATTSVDVSVGVGTVKTFTVTGSNFAFAPKTLTVNKGDKVKIIFKNSGGTHDIKIDEFSVASAKIQGGAETTVEFTADKVGTFEYYCSIGTHRAMGMVGTLTVK